MAAPEDEQEFRSYPDDAWYSVRAVHDGEKLRIKYSNFPGDHDDVFEASKFESLEKLEEFRCRFRRMSVQLQDRECSKVAEGLYLCASHAFSDYDVRFYDAVVEHVRTFPVFVICDLRIVILVLGLAKEETFYVNSTPNSASG